MYVYIYIYIYIHIYIYIYIYTHIHVYISFVRCIKPNGDERAGEFHETLVGLQLAAAGVLQVAN